MRRRAYRRWLVAASVAAFLASLIELVWLILPIPYASSEPLGLLHLSWSAHSLLALAAIPVAFVAGEIEHRFGPPPAPRPDLLISSMASVMVMWLLGRWLLRFREGTRNEFPDVLHTLPSALLLLVLIAGIALCWFVALPLAKPVVSRLGADRARRIFLAVGLAALALVSHWVSYSGLEPLNMGLVAGLAALSALLLWMLVARVVMPVVSLRVAALALAPAVLWLVSVPFGGLGNLHSRYLLFNQSVGPRTVATRVQHVLDFDGDGTAPRWAGGTDCAPWDGERGPGLRDIPGDGIDQDCSGMDAPLRGAAVDLATRCLASRQDLSVLLITIDAWRNDTMFSDVTQSVTQFASQSMVYSRAYAPANFTVHSVGSIFTGEAASELLGANPLDGQIPAVADDFVSRARQAGFATVALNHVSFPPTYSEGFGRRQSAGGHTVEASHRRDFLSDFTSANLTNELLRWIEGIGARRFVAWVHYADAHAPYLDPDSQGPLSEYNGTYGGALAYADYHVGRALRELSKRGLSRRTVIAVTADHGEEFGELNRLGHGTNVFESTSHVPLLLWVPGCPAQRIDDPVSLSQLAPTFASLLNLELRGHSLLATPSTPREGVVSEAISVGYAADENFFKRAFILGRYKLIDDVRRGGRLLFDLESDPTESRNIWSDKPDIRRDVLAAYEDWKNRPR